MDTIRHAALALGLLGAIAWASPVHGQATEGEAAKAPDMEHWTQAQKDEYWKLQAEQAIAAQRKATEDAKRKEKYGETPAPAMKDGKVQITKNDDSVSVWATYAAATSLLKRIQIPPNKCTSIALADWKAASAARARRWRIIAEIEAATKKSEKELQLLHEGRLRSAAVPGRTPQRNAIQPLRVSPQNVTAMLNTVVNLLGYFKTETEVTYKIVTVDPDVLVPALASQATLKVPLPVKGDYEANKALIDGMLDNAGLPTQKGEGEPAPSTNATTEPKAAAPSAKTFADLIEKKDLLIQRLVEDYALVKLLDEKSPACLLGVSVPDALAATTTSKSLWRSDKVFDRGAATIAWNLVDSSGTMVAGGVETMVCEADNKLSRRLNRTRLVCE